MSTQHLGRAAGDALRTLHREVRIALTPAPRNKHWVFVVGCYNSGTTLLSHLLGRHRHISALPVEGQFLTTEIEADYELCVPRMWTMREDRFRLTETDPGPDAARIKKEWAMRLDRSRPVFVEKSPPNAARTRWLQAHFRPASFIAIVRNGYAVAEGIRRKAEPRHLAAGWPLEECARVWARSNEILLEDAAHLKRVHWVRYEELSEDPAVCLAAMFEFLGLPPDGGVDLEGTWNVHERRDEIRNMNAESIARLTPEERRVVTDVAAPMLRRLGYEPLD